MWVSCTLRSGLLFVTLSPAVVKHKPAATSKSCYPWGTLSGAVDMLCVKAAWFKATIPVRRPHKKIRLLKKKTKRLFMVEKLQIQGQLLSFFMEDVFGQLQLQVRREIHFVEEFHSLRQKLSRCLSTHSRKIKPSTRMKRTFYKIGSEEICRAVRELGILLSWIKQFLESIKQFKKPSALI
uniref:Interleukin 26 n=1 Tax=Equus caballus TaxID=9796 RepID=A0A3Q2HV09_HORSE